MAHGDASGEFTQPTLAERVMTQTRDTFVKLHQLLSGDKYMGPEHQRPESEALDSVLDAFVVANFETLNSGVEVPFSPEVVSAIAVYRDAIVTGKFEFAIFKELERRQREEITKMLEGRTITARNLGRGIRAIDSQGTSLQPPLQEATGTFIEYNPSLATLELAREGGTYHIQLWERPLDHATRTVGEPQPAVELHIT